MHVLWGDRLLPLDGAEIVAEEHGGSWQLRISSASWSHIVYRDTESRVKKSLTDLVKAMKKKNTVVIDLDNIT